MEWEVFMQVALWRLEMRLREHERLHLQVRAFLKQYGFTPNDILVTENEQSLRQIAAYLQTINDQKIVFMPYRRGVDPHSNSGLSAVLKPMRDWLA